MDKVFSVLFAVCRGTPRHGEWVIACLQGAWPKLIGERLAVVCAPISFDGSVLAIGVKDLQWEEAVRSVEAVLLDKLRAATAGEVRKIRVVRTAS